MSSTSIASSGWLRRRAEKRLRRPPGCSGKGWLCGVERLWPELDDSVGRAERARLEEQRLAALEQRVEAELALGRDAELVPELEGLVREQPLRERLRGQLMLALYRCGRQADALEVYRSGRRLLDEELGLKPDVELQRLPREPSSTTIPSLASPVVSSRRTTPRRRASPNVVT